MPQVNRVPVTPPPATDAASLTAAPAASSPAIGGGRGTGTHAPTPQVQAPAAATPVAPESGVVTDVQFATMLQNLINGLHAPNPLNVFWQVAYHWRLFIMRDEDIYTQTQKPADMTALYNAMDGLQQITIAETGVTGYNIKSVETRALVGPNAETRNTNIFQFTLEIVEPISVGFLDALKDAALALEIKNLNKCPYFLELGFRAYDENGAVLNDPLSDQPDAHRWIWAIQITDIDTRLDAAGGQYTIKAQVYNDGAVETDILTVPKNLVMKGTTIGKVLNSLGTAMTESWQKRYGDKLVEYHFKMHPITRPPPTITDPDPNNYAMKAKNPTLRSVRLDPMQGAAGEIQAQVAAGTGYNDIVQWIMMNNENTETLGLDVHNTNLASIIDRIETDVEITGYDEVSANYAKRVYIHIWPYYTQAILTGPGQRDDAQNEAVQGKMVKALLDRRFLYKHYEYLHTGLNTEVLEFDIRSSFKWNAQLPNMGGRSSSIDNLEAARNLPPVSNALSVDKAAYAAKVKAINASNRNATVKLATFTAQSNDLNSQIDPLVRADQQALDIINNANNTNPTAAEIATARQVDKDLKAKLQPLVAQQTAIAQLQSDQHDLITANAKNLQTDRDTLFAKTTPPNFAEDLLKQDGTATTDASNFQYEYFNYAISFRQGYRDVSAQSGTGFLGAFHQAKSTFGALVDQLYQMETKQLANIELTIRGDPYWIGASNLNRMVLLRGGNNPLAGDDKAFPNMPNWYTGDQTFLLTFKYPILIGDDGKPVFKENDTFDGIYRVTEVTSTFADGVFKQRLKGQIVPLINIAEAFGNIKKLRSTGAQPQTGAASSGVASGSGSSSTVSPALTTPQQQANARAFKAALLDQAQKQGVSLTSAQADGIVANAYRESSMNPKATQIGGSGGAGLLQWTGTSNTAFVNAMGVAPQDATINQQAQYTIQNLAGSEHKALTQLQATTGQQDAAQAFLTGYERPSAANVIAGTSKNNSFIPSLFGPGQGST